MAKLVDLPPQVLQDISSFLEYESVTALAFLCGSSTLISKLTRFGGTQRLVATTEDSGLLVRRFPRRLALFSALCSFSFVGAPTEITFSQWTMHLPASLVEISIETARSMDEWLVRVPETNDPDTLYMHSINGYQPQLLDQRFPRLERFECHERLGSLQHFPRWNLAMRQRFLDHLPTSLTHLQLPGQFFSPMLKLPAPALPEAVLVNLRLLSFGGNVSLSALLPSVSKMRQQDSAPSIELPCAHLQSLERLQGLFHRDNFVSTLSCLSSLKYLTTTFHSVFGFTNVQQLEMPPMLQRLDVTLALSYFAALMRSLPQGLKCLKLELHAGYYSVGPDAALFHDPLPPELTQLSIRSKATISIENGGSFPLSLTRLALLIPCPHQMEPLSISNLTMLTSLECFSTFFWKCGWHDQLPPCFKRLVLEGDYGFVTQNQLSQLPATLQRLQLSKFNAFLLGDEVSLDHDTLCRAIRRRFLAHTPHVQLHVTSFEFGFEFFDSLPSFVGITNIGGPDFEMRMDKACFPPNVTSISSINPQWSPIRYFDFPSSLTSLSLQRPWISFNKPLLDPKRADEHLAKYPPLSALTELALVIPSSISKRAFTFKDSDTVADEEWPNGHPLFGLDRCAPNLRTLRLAVYGSSTERQFTLPFLPESTTSLTLDITGHGIFVQEHSFPKNLRHLSVDSPLSWAVLSPIIHKLESIQIPQIIVDSTIVLSHTALSSSIDDSTLYQACRALLPSQLRVNRSLTFTIQWISDSVHLLSPTLESLAYPAFREVDFDDEPSSSALLFPSTLTKADLRAIANPSTSLLLALPAGLNELKIRRTQAASLPLPPSLTKLVLSHMTGFSKAAMTSLPSTIQYLALSAPSFEEGALALVPKSVRTLLVNPRDVVPDTASEYVQLPSTLLCFTLLISDHYMIRNRDSLQTLYDVVAQSLNSLRFYVQSPDDPLSFDI